MRHCLVVAVCVAGAALSGCVTDDAANSTGRGNRHRSVSEADEEAVRESTSAFLTLVATRNYDKVAEMVLPKQAGGFEARDFVKNRFRMKLDEFEAFYWDMRKISVTAVKDKKAVLSSTVVAVRLTDTNEGRPVVVNLYWQKKLGKWLLAPFPEVL